MAHKVSRAPAVPARRSAARPVAVPSAAELKQAKEDALFQLELGRSAHYYTVVISAALAVDAFLVLFVSPVLHGGLVAIVPASVQNLYFLAFPLFGGVALSFLGLRVKWEAFQLWPWEPHFALTVASVALDVLLAVLYLSNLSGYGPAAHWAILPWFYPLAMAAISLPMASLGLTWKEWTNGKMTSVAAAVLPAPIALAVLIPSLGATSTINLLTITLFVGAVLYQTSGSALHLMSSGTEPHQRQVITSGQGRLYSLAEELRNKEEAIRFREKALLARETDVELSADAIAQERTAIDATRAEVEANRSEFEGRVELHAAKEKEVTVQVAQTQALQKALEDRQRAVGLREQEIQRVLPKLQEREDRLNQQESAFAQREATVSQRETSAQARDQSQAELDARLKTRRDDVEKRSQELIQKEIDLAGKAPFAAAGATDASDLARKLAERESKTAQLQVVLNDQNATLGRKAKELQALEAQVKSRATDLASREAAVSAREATLGPRERDAGDRLERATQQRTAYEAALTDLESRRNEVAKREADLQARADELQRVGQAIHQREAAMKTRDSELGVRGGTVDQRLRQATERLKEIEAREAELRLREQELALAPSPAVASGAVAEKERAFAAREAKLRQREQELQRREYAVSHAPAASGDGLLTAPPATKRADRLPTGTGRLDDLLLGGVPPKGHVLLVGPAFSGKEVALYAFLVEGLKRGEPAVLVTAGRSPDEVSQEIGILSPQFREYEQLGRVTWIDASNPTVTANGSGHRLVAKGPDDHAGILSSLVQAAKSSDGSNGGAFRVGFLGLSASLAHADERRALSFIPNLVGILKPRNAIAMYTADAGVVPDTLMGATTGRMDGSIEFKEERGKTFLRVQGFGEVATRDWVEYRATSRALVVGSFALERIR